MKLQTIGIPETEFNNKEKVSINASPWSHPSPAASACHDQPTGMLLTLGELYQCVEIVINDCAEIEINDFDSLHNTPNVASSQGAALPA